MKDKEKKSNMSQDHDINFLNRIFRRNKFKIKR